MQKKVIAAVVGALLISPAAFADVKISGRLSAGVESYKLEAGNAAAPQATYSGETRVSDQSSSVVFTGSEDLGGGLSAWFKIDNRFNFPNASATWGESGNTQIGLAGSWGKLALGRSDLHYNEMFRYDAGKATSLQSWVTSSVFSQVNGANIANTTRWPNVIKYDGSSGAVSYTLGYSASGAADPAGQAPEEGSGAGATNTGKGSAFVATLRYQQPNGPLSLGCSLWKASPEDGNANDTGEQTSNRCWGGYTFGIVSIALGYDKSEVKGSLGERTALALPIKIHPPGPNTFYVKFAQADDRDLNGTINNSGASIMNVGWDHALSKSTYIAASYTKLDNDANATYNLFAVAGSTNSGTRITNPGEGVSQIYFGIAHFY
jgi:predicted porin